MPAAAHLSIGRLVVIGSLVATALPCGCRASPSAGGRTEGASAGGAVDGSAAAADRSSAARAAATAADSGSATTARQVRSQLRFSGVDSVLLVTIDTLRADVLGLHGGPAATPALDALGAEGWDFQQCIAASMLTNPSHASLMTSLYLRDHGVYDNESGLHDDARTLAVALQRFGLRTAAVINFPHLNPEVANLGQGFDKIVPAGRQERRAPETTAAALEALDEIAPSEPFFMWVHYADPHAPYDPPPEISLPALAGNTPMSVAERAAPGFQRNNPWFKKAFGRYATTEELVRRYWAEVEAADRGLSMLIDGLARRGRLARTAIIVTSDHGENLGEHGLYFHHGGLFREAVQVPLIIRVPGATPVRIAGLVESVDVAPTILEILGAPTWEPMRGKSLVAIATEKQPARAFAFAEHQLGQLVAVYSEAGVLIRHRKTSQQFPTYPFVAGREELYDLASDPRMQKALPATGPLAETLRAALARYLGASLEVVGRKAANQDRESLRALGYLE